ncbi:DUF4258 domain-containing protein [bacterium]|nr:DUF4258 domain-containing protein [bacterium]
MFERNISEEDVRHVISNGTIIEEYKDDFPFPSFLLNGKVKENRYIHIVLGLDANNQRIYIITVYEPEPALWKDNYSRRIT